MHICVFSPDFPTSRTIDFVFVEQLCRAMAEKGHTVTVVAPQTLTKCFVRHIPVSKGKIKVNVSAGKYYTLIRPKYFSVGKLGGVLKNHNGKSFKKAAKRGFGRVDGFVDVIYGHFWQAVSAAYPIAMKHNIPLFASSGEETVNKKRIGYTDDRIEYIKQYIGGSIHVSTNNRIECLATGLTTEEKSIVIPNAINDQLFYIRDKQNARREFGINQDDFVVTFVGQFTDRKGTLRLDAALKKLNDNRIKAIFVGQGPEDPSYRGIIFKGRRPHDELPVILSASDIFVLPTRQEGCCNAIIEALACGLPVISSDLTFNYDVLNRDNSIMINQEDVNEIADAIRALKENPDRRKEMSEHAIETAKGLTLDKRVDKIIYFISQSIKPTEE
jgi:glycosyltransferase involved in cell wall biosynthesis